MRRVLGVGAALGFFVCACGSAKGGFAAGDGGPGADAKGKLDSASSKDATVILTTDTGGCSKQVTCQSAGAVCGYLDDGCGGKLTCGTCPSGQTCGGGGANKCGAACAPATCASLKANCGVQSDGCGGTITCGDAGTCPSGETCGGGGKPNVCGSGSCTKNTCASLNAQCGVQSDGCGGSLDCGTCDVDAGQTCGGGGTPNVCGSGGCTPATCKSGQCGAVPDGCGSLIQCGSCTSPELCGGSPDAGPTYCGVPEKCTNLCQQQVTCSDAGTAADGAAPLTTTISGTVYAPNGTDPLPNVLVYIPNGTVQPFTDGVACEPCSAGVTGSPLVSAATDTHGRFTLVNAPAGTDIPLVIQTGRWRRQTVIPKVTACTDNALPVCSNVTAASGACLTSLPQTQSQGDIPLIAFATGSIDGLECVMLKIGVSKAEFTNPGAGGRINLYVGFEQKELGIATVQGGARIDTSTPTEDVLVGTASTLNQYDMVLFPCESAPMAGGSQVWNQQTKTQLGTWNSLRPGYQKNVIDYANAGGRVFATHYSYIWLYNDPPFNQTAKWDVDHATADGGGIVDQPGYIDTSFPKGLELAEWLQNVGASTMQGVIPLNTLKWDIDPNGIPDPPSVLWMQIQDPTYGDIPMHYTFNTPVSMAADAGAPQCGKVLFDDFHVESVAMGTDPLVIFPKECPSGAMTPQEKLLEFMIFDLGSCVSPDNPTCTASTCVAQNISCGPADDGCGNLLDCGTCPSGQTCGGGGVPSQCGAPSCTSRTCAQQNISCGTAGDGCGNAISCGTCNSPQTCGGGGTPGVCGAGTCKPLTCSQQGINCGTAGDGCGNAIDCGTCPGGQTCGGGGKSGVCGSSCVPKTCVELGYNCGMAGDGCGNEINCGTCSAPLVCGGGGTPGVCGGSIP